MNTQFDLAQQAANTAYDMTLESTHDEAQAAADYHAVMDAYNKRVIMVRHIDGTVEMDSRIAYTDQRVEDVEPLCEATMEKWHEYLAGMSDDEIARLDFNSVKGDCAL